MTVTVKLISQVCGRIVKLRTASESASLVDTAKRIISVGNLRETFAPTNQSEVLRSLSASGLVSIGAEDVMRVGLGFEDMTVTDMVDSGLEERHSLPIGLLTCSAWDAFRKALRFCTLAIILRARTTDITSWARRWRTSKIVTRRVGLHAGSAVVRVTLQKVMLSRSVVSTPRVGTLKNRLRRHSESLSQWLATSLGESHGPTLSNPSFGLGF